MCFEYIRPEKVSVLRADTIAIAHNNLDFRGRGDFFCQMTTGLFEQLLRQPESEMLDFKSSQYRFIRATDIEKSELLKDILAFSNVARQADAYILIGVEEVKGNRGIVRGVNDHLNDSDLQQFVCSKTNRPPVFSYSAFEIHGLSCGVIRISVQKRPIFLLKDFGKLKANAVYLRRGSSTDEANPDEIAQMNAAELDSGKPLLEIIVEPRIVPHINCKCLELQMWINNRGKATADDVVVVLQKQPIGVFGIGYGSCSQTTSGHPGNALKLNAPLNPGDRAFLCSTDLGQVEGSFVATFEPVEFGVKILARNQVAFDVGLTFTKTELFAGKTKTATRR